MPGGGQLVDPTTGNKIPKKTAPDALSPLQIAMNLAQEQLAKAESMGNNVIRGMQLATVNPTGVADLKNYLGFLIPKRSKI